MTAPAMTRADALAEARKRWGDEGYGVLGARTGYIKERRSAYQGSFRFQVGYYRQLPKIRKWYLRGAGNSWEAAFADADRRAKP